MINRVPVNLVRKGSLEDLIKGDNSEEGASSALASPVAIMLLGRGSPRIGSPLVEGSSNEVVRLVPRDEKVRSYEASESMSPQDKKLEAVFGTAVKIVLRATTPAGSSLSGGASSPYRNLVNFSPFASEES